MACLPSAVAPRPNTINSGLALAAERPHDGRPAFQRREEFAPPHFASRSDSVNQRYTIMANTYTSLHYHFVFSTKNREQWLGPDVEQRVWEYLGGIARQNRMKALQIGGVDDHVHLVVGLPPTLTVSKALQLLKGGSSKWIHDTFPTLASFEWQDGYGAFTISKSQLPGVIEYVANQREHHRVVTFQDEYREFLKRHRIDFDERYLWG
jgi:putative transposase